MQNACRFDRIEQKRLGSYEKLAEKMDVLPPVISDWKAEEENQRHFIYAKWLKLLDIIHLIP